MAKIITWAIMAIMFVFAAILVFWIIYAFVKYGNTPISEVPAWAVWFMFGRK